MATYSNNLKKLLEELNCLEPRPRCTCTGCKCDIYKKLEDIDSANNVLQFLMGLNESYNAVVSNILLLDPLPSFNKTYSIISRVERQRSEINTSVTAMESSVLAVRAHDTPKIVGAVPKNFAGKKDMGKKSDRYCTHCKKSGHLEEACFKKHGYPDWFKEMRNQNPKQNKGQMYANNVNYIDGDVSQDAKGSDSASISEMIQQEALKYMKGKSVAEDNPVAASCFTDFAGISHVSSLTQKG